MISNVIPLLVVTAGFLHIIYRHWAAGTGNTRNPVSYTHLTLPTNREV